MGQPDLTAKNFNRSAGALLAVAALVMAALVWSYWTMFAELVEEWSKNPLYSHGYLVPAFAAALLWIRREQMPVPPLQPSRWALAFLAVGSVMRLGAAYFYYAWPDRISLLFMIFAAVLAMAGWKGFRWSWPSILFLAFMIPFPGFVESGLIRHLRPIATVASTNVLQTLGFFAQREGNVIVLSSTELGVAEACSGLGMLSVFVALTVAACLVVSRPLWQKFVIVLSSIPIAVLCNIVRISATGVMCEIGDADFAKNQFHDGAGWAMMPLALGLLLVELKLLDFVYELNPDEAKPARAQPVPVPG